KRAIQLRIHLTLPSSSQKALPAASQRMPVPSGSPSSRRRTTSRRGPPMLIPRHPSRRCVDTFSASWPENAGPARIDPFANANGAVSAAFLQLVESHGHGLSDEGFSLLRLLLRDGYLPQDELLAVVDWGRLLSLAVTSVSRVLDYPTGPVVATTPCHSGPAHSRRLLASGEPATLSYLHGVDNFDHSGPADMMLDHPISDYQLHDMPIIGSAVQPLFSSRRSSHAASPIPPSGTARIPCFDPELCHSPEQQQPASQTQNSTIVDAVDAPKRRCLHCAVDHTTQWRTHPKGRGYLCNACGQHQWRHSKPRSLQAIMRERARANDEHTVMSPSNPPQKRGGEVMMRVPLKQARHN
ncbi:hypothetical protein B0H13DRAFT_2150906, partial [Mycena leptocephala]